MPLSYFLILDEVFRLVLMMGEAVMLPADPIEKGKLVLLTALPNMKAHTRVLSV